MVLAILPAAIAVRPSPALAVNAVVPLDPWPSAPQMTATTGDLSGTFAISDNVDRLLVMLVSSYDSGGSSGQTFAASYGDQPLIQAFLQNSDGWQTWIGYLAETGIAARGGDAVTVTITGPHTEAVAYIATYSGVDQASPVPATGTYISNANNQPIGGPLAVALGGYGIYGWSGRGGRTRGSDSESYVEQADVDNPATFNHGVASLYFAGAGSTNPSVTWSQNNRVSVSFITLNPSTTYPVPATTGISPASRSTGDAAFTLTVSGANFVNGASVVRLDGDNKTTTYVSSTQLTADISAADLAAPGNRSVTVFTASPGGGESNAQILAVRAVPDISWADPAGIVYGTALGDGQLCASSSVPGTFTYSPAAGAMLPAGDGQTLHVEFAPDDTSSYAPATRNVTINVSKASLAVTAGNITKGYGTALDLPLAGFVAAGLVNGDTVDSVTLASAGAGAEATVDGSPYAIVPAAAAGTGLGNYSITYVNGTLTVSKAVTTITLQSSASTSGKGGSATLTASVADRRATGIVTFYDGDAIIGSSVLIDGTATFTASALSSGSHSIAAVYGGDANHDRAASTAIDLTMEKAAGPGWALIAALAAAGIFALLCLLLLLRRRRRAAEAETAQQAIAALEAIGRSARNLRPGALRPGVTLAATDGSKEAMALPTVEDVGTYSIQLERELDSSLRKVQQSMESTIQAVCRTVESRDPYISGHQKRVSQLACTIAKEMGLTAWQIEGIRVAGLLHDIGKITVPTEILSKPGKLSEMEMAMMREHPKVAYDILKNIEFDWPVARIVVQHHERMDGSGYPYGTKGENILVEARILAVADVVEAMSSYRPYRDALGVKKALAELERGKGTIYDEDVVRACKTVINERGFKVELAGTTP